jgi:uncharacterized membrane protein YbaN (DUF454 family)
MAKETIKVFLMIAMFVGLEAALHFSRISKTWKEMRVHHPVLEAWSRTFAMHFALQPARVRHHGKPVVRPGPFA